MERGDRLGSVVRTFISRGSQLMQNPGDKTNHIPAIHIPQIYYFIAFSTIMGWPALISGKEGLGPLIHGIVARMWGSKRSATRSPSVLRCSPHTQAECCDASVNPPDGIQRPSLYVSVCDFVDDDGLLKLAVFITHSCCLITVITRSTFGGGFSCCTLSYHTF